MIDISGLMLDMEQLQNENGNVSDDDGGPDATLDDEHFTVVMVSNGKPVLAAQPGEDRSLDELIGSWLSAGTVDGVVLGDYDEAGAVLYVDKIKEA